MKNQNDSEVMIPLSSIKKISRINTGASWIKWIGILSIINTIVFSFGSNVSFVVGLGVTQIFTAVIGSFYQGGVVIWISIVFSLFVSSFFLILDYFARQQKLWAFVVAVVIYGLDALLFLPIGDLLSFGFHIYAGYFIVVAIRELITDKQKSSA